MRVAYRLVEYSCDAPGCSAAAEEIGVSFPVLARSLRAQGWQIDRWDALCQAHAPASTTSTPW